MLQTDGSWNADSGSVWDLLNDEQRPYTWTSADAAGLPVFAGLARYDEVASGQIKHALRLTLQNSQTAFTPPASHWAGNSTDAYAPPMGMRMRLKSTSTSLLFATGPGDSGGAEEVRHDHGRQWKLDVPEWRS